MKKWAQKLKLRLPAMLLLAVTLLFWKNYDRYERTGELLLETPAMVNATRFRGDCAETNGRFILNVPSPGQTASLNFRIPNAVEHDLIRVRASMKVDGVVIGKYHWNSARLLLVQYDKNDRRVPGEHGVVSESGTKGWKVHEDVFEIMPETVHADLVLQQTGKAGAAAYDQIRVEPVRLRGMFFVWQAVFSALWVSMAALYYKRCRLNVRRLRILILLNALAILTGTIIPGEWIADSSTRLKSVLLSKMEHHSETAERLQPIQRIEQFNEMVGGVHVAGHYFLFTSLCFLVYWSAALERQQGTYYFKVAFDILLFAAITEALQNLTLDRSANLFDWKVDLVGLSTGLVLFLATRAVVYVAKNARWAAS